MLMYIFRCIWSNNVDLNLSSDDSPINLINKAYPHLAAKLLQHSSSQKSLQKIDAQHEVIYNTQQMDSIRYSFFSLTTNYSYYLSISSENRNQNTTTEDIQ